MLQSRFHKEQFVQLNYLLIQMSFNNNKLKTRLGKSCWTFYWAAKNPV